MGFVKNAIAYSGTNLISQAAMFVQAFVLRILLLPEVMGVWNFIQVIRGYVAPISLGAINGAFRELPILKGQGKRNEQVLCRSVALTASLAEAFVLALYIVAYVYFRGGANTSQVLSAFYVAAALLILTRFHEAYITFFQGAQLYVSLSRLLLVNGLIFAVLLPAGAWTGGLPGLLIAAVIAQMIRALWFVTGGRRQGLEVAAKWNISIWKRLVSFGIGYRLADYPLTLFMMLDLLWVTKFMDVKALAIYATARSLCHQAFDITARFGTVFYTRVLENFGESVSKEKMAHDFRKFIQFQLLVGFPLVCWIVVATVPFLVRQIIPRYVDSLPLILPLVVSGFFIPQNNHLFAIWMAEKKLMAYGISNLFGLTFTVTVLVVFWYGLGYRRMIYVSIATILGYGAHFIYLMLAIGRELFGGPKALKIFFQVILGAGWVGAVFILVDPFKVVNFNFGHDLVFTLKTAVWSFLGIAPLLLYGLWTSGGWSLLNKRWKDLTSVRHRQ